MMHFIYYVYRGPFLQGRSVFHRRRGGATRVLSVDLDAQDRRMFPEILRRMYGGWRGSRGEKKKDPHRRG